MSRKNQNLTVHQEYFNIVVPRMLLLLSLDERALPPAHRRALAFSLSRMLANDEKSEIKQLVMSLVFSMLHEPILHGKSVSFAVRALAQGSS